MTPARAWMTAIALTLALLALLAAAGYLSQVLAPGNTSGIQTRISDSGFESGPSDSGIQTPRPETGFQIPEVGPPGVNPQLESTVFRGPSPTPTATPLPVPTSTPTPLLEPAVQETMRLPIPVMDVFAAEVLLRTNEARLQVGRSALTPSAVLVSSAQAYAEVLALSDWWSHTGPDGSTPFDRIDYTGWRAEILYRGPVGLSSTEVVAAWLGSPAHRDALLGEQFTEVGVGCAVAGDTQWCVEHLGGP